MWASKEGTGPGEGALHSLAGRGGTPASLPFPFLVLGLCTEYILVLSSSFKAVS